ncbi:MAG: hypothetical protein H0T42_32005 [Deltaproteobacteria bacterium]|nr:hypothetical protein [Deltaproteobacteria bacterium]
MIAAYAPPTSPIRTWLAELGEHVTDDPSSTTVIVVSADDRRARAPSPTIRTIACLPVERTDHWHVATDAEQYAAIRADGGARAGASGGIVETMPR